MTRYYIIAAAVLVGVIIGFLMSPRRKSARETVLVEEKPPINLVPWIAGILTLMLGLYLISDDTRAPIDAEYRPSALIDGELVPGTFGTTFDATTDQPEK
jgi:hypothetical protein